jgi:8-amino-3,8-dideoxy-alpha-D-manno-octulosonate transaminase
MEKLAVKGGSPVRKQAFPPKYLGAALYGDEELAQVTDVIRNKSPFRHYGIGTPGKTASLEKKAADYIGVKYALAVSSGSGALNCAVIALGIGPGDEVILPAFGWYSNFLAITQSGALPVFADIDETLGIDPADFEKKISKNTKAVMVVDFQGCPANMDAIMSIAKARNIRVIEDIAQAFGGDYKGKKLGTIGDIAIASFQMNKMISCGEGGMVLTNNSAYFARAVRYHDLGQMRNFFSDQIEDKSLLNREETFAGGQYRMSELQSAVMLAQLDRLDGIIRKCRGHHARIRDSFRDNGHFSIRHIDGECGVTLFMLFPAAAEAGEFLRCLAGEGVEAGPLSACKNLMPIPPVVTKKLAHDAMPPFGKGFAGENVDYLELSKGMRIDEISARVVAVAIGALYTDGDVDDIIAAIRKVDENLY